VLHVEATDRQAGSAVTCVLRVDLLPYYGEFVAFIIADARRWNKRVVLLPDGKNVIFVAFTKNSP